MDDRWGLGPVFHYELLLASRRRQLYVVRSLVVALLLIAFCLVWWGYAREEPDASVAKRLAAVGESLFTSLVSTQLTLVLLAAPAATAGAVCQDKAHGALVHLLVTDLSDAEVVLGKLASRLLPVLGLIAASLPVMAIGLSLGGIDGWALLGAYLVMVGVAVLGCTAAFTLSVWGRKTHEVLLVAYVLVFLELMLVPFWMVSDHFFGVGAAPGWLELTNPYALVMAPYSQPGFSEFAPYLWFLGVSLAVAALLVLLTVLRLRAVIIRQAGQAERESRRGRWRARLRLPSFWPGVSLDRNPVLWREWHRKRPSRWMRAVWGLYVGLGGLASLLTALDAVNNPPGPPRIALAMIPSVLVAIGLLFVSVSSVTALADERARGSLDVLLSTPLPTSQIVWGKWWGACRAVPLLVVLPGLLAGLSAGMTGQWWPGLLAVAMIPAYGAVVGSLGLALAVRVPRFGWAVTASVACYVVLVVGVMVLGMVLNNSWGISGWGIGLATGSPWFGTYLAFAAIEIKDLRENLFYPGGCLIWLAVDCVASALLYLIALLSFDRCLGRATGTRPTTQPPAAPQAAVPLGAGARV